MGDMDTQCRLVPAVRPAPKGAAMIRPAPKPAVFCPVRKMLAAYMYLLVLNPPATFRLAPNLPAASCLAQNKVHQVLPGSHRGEKKRHPYL